MKGRKGPYNTPIHLLFAREYVANGGQGKKAVITVGMSEKSAAQRSSVWLKRDDVKAEIARLMAEADKRATMTAEDVISTYEAIADADIGDVCSWANEDEVVKETVEKDGKTIHQTIHRKGIVFTKPSRDLDPRTRRAIKRVAKTREGFTVEMHDKNAALGRLEAIKDMESVIVKHKHTGSVQFERRIIDSAEDAGEPDSTDQTDRDA